MATPGFFAEESLSKTNRHYRLRTAFAASIGSQVSPTIAKGTHCVADPECPTGFSKLFCPSFNIDDCVETGICCTPGGGGGGGGGGGPVNCGDHLCPSGNSCCGPSCCSPGSVCCFDSAGHCCPAGTHCCSDGHGCCPDGQKCRSIFGWHFCSPI
jgi:hypothetical protein